jgi:alpha-amylase
MKTLLSLLFSFVVCHAFGVVLVLQVNMSGTTIGSAGVHVMGTFNSWNPNGPLMTNLGGNIYEQAFTVNANSTVQFKFVNGANTTDGESVPASCAVSGNRQIQVGVHDTLIGPLCFGQCADCASSTINTANVTFRVDLSGLTISPQGVHLGGNFQNWSATATPMVSQGNNIYTKTVTVPANSQVLYKFINGDTWADAETVPSSCGQSDGFGGFNRAFNIGSLDLVLDTVCFAACTGCTVGIEDYSITLPRVWPIPASDNIRYQLPIHAEQCFITNALGERMAMLPRSTFSGEISIGSWPDGIYFMHAVLPTGYFTTRFVKKN